MPYRYQDHYNPEMESTSMCEARYIPRVDTENPYITALPRRRSVEELRKDFRTAPVLPPPEKFNQLNFQDQLASIAKLRYIRTYLNYYEKIENAVDSALVDSYNRRASIKSNRPYGKYMFQDENTEAYRHSDIKGLGNAPTGFAIIGQSGCGKSTGIKGVLSKYPACIIHNPGTMEQHIQIPIIAVEMPKNENFHGLYRAIGEKIDKALDNNSHTYKTELGRKGDTLGDKFSKLCDLISILHIGLIIVDEIQRISLKKVKEETMETFMSLSNNTGVSVAVIGTEESYEQLFFRPRTARRLSPLINGDKYCSNIKSVENILNILYFYLPDKMTLTSECLNAYYRESRGIMDYILRIFVEVAVKIVEGKQKNKTVTVNDKLIKTIAKSVVPANKDIAHQIIVQDENLASETMRMLHGEQNADAEPTIANVVKCTIRSIFNDKFTDSQIKTALDKAIKTVGNNDIAKLIAETGKTLAS